MKARTWILVAAAFTLAAGAASATDCAALLAERSRSDLSLPFETFDQDMKSGWRELERLGCPAEAANLIERYSLQHDFKARALRWHSAQMHAIAGNLERALAAAQASVNPEQASQHPDFDWNDYVYATIAFLRNDKPTFERHRMLLREATAKEPANQPNVLAVERLASCFGKPYKEAYSCNAP